MALPADHHDDLAWYELQDTQNLEHRHRAEPISVVRRRIIEEAGFHTILGKLEGRLADERRRLIEGIEARQKRATQIEHIKLLTHLAQEANFAVDQGLLQGLRFGYFQAFGLPLPIEGCQEHEQIPIRAWAELRLESCRGVAVGTTRCFADLYMAQTVISAASPVTNRLAQLFGWPEGGDIRATLPGAGRVRWVTEVARDGAHPSMSNGPTFQAVEKRFPSEVNVVPKTRNQAVSSDVETSGLAAGPLSIWPHVNKLVAHLVTVGTLTARSSKSDIARAVRKHWPKLVGSLDLPVTAPSVETIRHHLKNRSIKDLVSGRA